MKDLRPGTRIHIYKGPNKGRDGTIIGPGSTRDRLLIQWDAPLPEPKPSVSQAKTYIEQPAAQKEPQTLFP